MEWIGPYPLEHDRKRYADDVTVKDMVRLRVENEIFGFALDCIAKMRYSDSYAAVEEMQRIANDAIERAAAKRS